MERSNMRKKLLNILLIGIMTFSLAGCGSSDTIRNQDKISDETNISYQFGDKVNVQLNNQELELGNVIKDDGSTVQVLLQTVSTNLEYKDLDYHMDAKKQSWTNVENVELLSVEYFFDKCEMTANHIMDGYVCKIEEKNSFLLSTAPYWLSGNDSHNAHCHAGNGDISNCSWYVQSQEIALADKSYIETGFRPVVTISKEYLSKATESNKTYQLYDQIKLKDDSKWIVLEDLGDEILLIKTKKNALVENSRINSILSENEQQLKTSLESLNQNVSKLEMRIPTSKDLEKYFKFDFSKEDDGRVYGMTLNTDVRNVTKDWEYSSFWVKKDSNYISCKTSNGQMYCSMSEMDDNETWHVLIILQINKSNIE